MKFAFFDGFYVMQPLKKGVHYTKFPPQYPQDVGYGLINDQWMTDKIEINGINRIAPPLI